MLVDGEPATELSGASSGEPDNGVPPSSPYNLAVTFETRLLLPVTSTKARTTVLRPATRGTVTAPRSSFGLNPMSTPWLMRISPTARSTSRVVEVVLEVDEVVVAVIEVVVELVVDVVEVVVVVEEVLLVEVVVVEVLDVVVVAAPLTGKLIRFQPEYKDKLLDVWVDNWLLPPGVDLVNTYQLSEPSGYLPIDEGVLELNRVFPYVWPLK